MRSDTLADLRATSLAATLVAARGRRIRRRTFKVAGTTAILAAIGLLFPKDHPPIPPGAPVIAIQPTATPATVETIRTHANSTARISTEQSSVTRFSTESTAPVERIGNDDLVRCFPDKGIALIYPQGVPARLFLFQ